MQFARLLFATITLMSSLAVLAQGQEVVVRDGEVEITRAELEAALKSVPDYVKAAAAKDPGERLQIINSLLQTRKMAAKADKLSPDAQDYWKLQFQLQAVKKDFIFKREQSEVTMPNAKRLVEEYYKTKKDKYAKVPELRASSHILLASPPGQPRDGVRARAQKLLDELRAGADFKEYVATYSEDPGSKARGGALQSWMRRGDPNFTPPYSEALFDIESVGGYSEITDSPFGIHIIRLDGIKEASYKDFDEVKAEIFEDIVADYRSLVAKEVAARYNISDDAFVDGAAMDQLFSPVTPP